MSVGGRVMLQGCFRVTAVAAGLSGAVGGFLGDGREHASVTDYARPWVCRDVRGTDRKENAASQGLHHRFRHAVGSSFRC